MLNYQRVSSPEKSESQGDDGDPFRKYVKIYKQYLTPLVICVVKQS